MRPTTPSVMAFVCLLASMSATVLAQQAQPEPKPEDIVTRTYLVGDLVRNTSNYPLVEQPFATSQPSAEESDSLIQLIQDTVASDTWKDNGGSVGSLRFYHSVLVVTQTKANHELILTLLEDLRRSGWAAQLTIRATWVVVNQGDTTKPMTEASAEWMAKQKIYSETQLTCFNGQTVHITSGREKRIISDLTPVVGTQSVAFDPSVEQVRSGVSVQFCAMLVGNDAAVVDVQSDATEWTAPMEAQTPAMEKASAPDLPLSQPTHIDRVPTLRQEMKTTVRVPLKKKIIVGGMTLDASDAQQGGRQLYLVVELEAGK